MACFHPIQAWRSKTLNASGKRGIVFRRKDGYADLELKVPCGQCVGCRLERSRQWAMRCVHEAQMWPRNSFVTLTYNDDHLPYDRSLNYLDFQLFQKRLRKRTGPNVRFYMCGEYGEQFGRPHYHVCYFNYDFHQDRKVWKLVNEQPLFVSEMLSETWGKGYATIGSLTFESAAYVARYIMKKQTGDPAREHYEWIDPSTGEIFDRRPEFNNMSRMPGIGRAWWDKYKADVINGDFVVMNGKKLKPPKYYDALYEAEFPGDYASVKARRKRDAEKRSEDNTPARLAVREKVVTARLKQLKRTIE